MSGKNMNEEYGRILRGLGTLAARFRTIAPQIRVGMVAAHAMETGLQEITRQFAEPLRRVVEAGGYLQEAGAYVQKVYGDLFRVLGPRFEAWLRAQEEAAAILVQRGWWPQSRKWTSISTTRTPRVAR